MNQVAVMATGNLTQYSGVKEDKMCLAYEYRKKFKGSTGWKLLTKRNGVLRSGMMHNVVYQEGKFIEVPEHPSRIHLSKDEGTYPAGSHIFTRREDAERVQKEKHWRTLVLCKVQFKEQVAYGEVHWVFTHIIPPQTWRDAVPDAVTPTVIARQVKVLEVIGGY